MTKKYFYTLIFIFGLFACQEKELINGIFVTGDHTTRLDFWQGENNEVMRITNFKDSSSISYPAYWLNISDRYIEFYHQADANSARMGYFALNPTIKQNTRDILELENVKLIFARGIVAGVELIGADETKNVILNGRIEKK